MLEPALVLLIREGRFAFVVGKSCAQTERRHGSSVSSVQPRGPRQRLRLTQCHGAARAALQSAERWEVVVRQWNNKVVVQEVQRLANSSARRWSLGVENVFFSVLSQ